ncbi:EAL domain-containing response regulator [Pseudoteredinibacter isoporae]|uniref:Diguanylate cyclase (GGDEF)-like protein n=1 Tax=Pseudoteredinibacter isoporae TaxID=570281 RepID=A0A7X0JRZ3_9GAMM|nr:EAL domain-containing protein [Pseudoteredinibacter isoporae]MBB6521077.1 diguanylate cyclase (GGDEF)-like protein [Pseudoteredinibacter isoporae]NHO86641.1 EAL domain-containing protein [Pseudoteredinibacter isoporae]NIB24907.1 EAL domain-containing protein [Pseudoteredinibacter isoporae]
MMISDQTLRLLILNDSESEAERLISMLHNAGKNVRAQLVTAETMEAQLQEQNWELLIAEDSAADVDHCIQAIRRHNKDVPVILQSDREGSHIAVEGMKRGASDVVQLDQDQHLLLVIDREVENRRQRQQRIQSDKKRREAEQRAHELLDSSRDGIAFIQDGLCLYVNKSFAELLKYQDAEEVECTPVIDLVEESQQAEVKSFLQEFTLQGGELEQQQYKLRCVCSDDSIQELLVSLNHGRFEEEPCIELRTQSNVQDQDMVEEMQKMKQLDHGTGLYNRQYMSKHLNQLLNTEAPKAFVMLIEIDNFFEQVQPKVGLSASDDVLKQIAELILPCLGEKDILTRFADDAFMVLSHLPTMDAVQKCCESILKSCGDSIIEANNKTVQVNASIGVAVVNENSSDSDTVIDQAAEAINSIRSEESEDAPKIKIYEPKRVGSEKTNADDIQKAIAQGRFRLLFQPVISLRGSGEEFYEVLLRMLDEHGEEISPAHFLDLAKSIGSATKLDRWVILESMKTLAKQRSQSPKTKLMITVSAESIQDRTLISWVSRVLQAAKIGANSVAFQISEKDANQNLKETQSFIKEVQGIKASCVITNFGCSLNPSNTIKHLETDLYKVDGSFAMDIQNNNQSPDALIALLGELHEAGKTSFIPQVENASILSSLWQAGVHYIQGHYLQAPAPAMEYDFTMDG